MVYNNTVQGETIERNESGFSVFVDPDENGYPVYEIYTDDGAGNGDFVCVTPDRFWAFRIANALDMYQES